ncbi:MAG TPA: response regulator transcription factor [Cyclobacteriaceae bacterium]|nr:response regulator transcription factor [Cyclobacteriaceae bacterium]
MSDRRIKVVLVDDHHIVLDGLESLLQQEPEFQVMASLRSGEEVLEFLKSQQPNILLTDFSLPGISGIDFVRQVRRVHPQVKIIVLSMHDEAHIIKSVLKEGVEGYLLKNIQHSELKSAVRHVAQGLPYVSPEVTRLLMDEMNKPKDEPELLTERELDVLRLIAKEFSNKEIADKLFISERTVETHRKNIFRKTKTSSLVGLIKFAYEHKMV